MAAPWMHHRRSRCTSTVMLSWRQSGPVTAPCCSWKAYRPQRWYFGCDHLLETPVPFQQLRKQPKQLSRQPQHLRLSCPPQAVTMPHKRVLRQLPRPTRQSARRRHSMQQRVSKALPATRLVTAQCQHPALQLPAAVRSRVQPAKQVATKQESGVVSAMLAATHAGGDATEADTQHAFPADEVERAPSNITAEQLSEAQMAVERATRGLTGPDAAKHLEPDGGGSAERSLLSRNSAPHGRQRDNWPADGGHPYRSPGSTPSSSPRGGRGLRTGSGNDWSATGRSARRASGGPLSRRTSGQSERDEFGASSRLRHSEADWPQQRGQQVLQVPLPPPRGRQLPPPAGARAMDGRLLGGMGRQLSLPGAAFGSPAHMISKVKLSMDGEAAALQQAALQHQAMMHRRALRNGTLAAARPVTHEAFEFWHEQQPDTAAGGGVSGLGAPLDSHDSREGGSLYSNMAADEPAAQAVRSECGASVVACHSVHLMRSHEGHLSLRVVRRAA